MKNFTLTIAIVLTQLLLYGQCPQGNIIFETQSQIDSFQILYPNCTEIEGSVTITGDDITNLNGLSVLTSIGGDLSINGNNLLTSLTGLDNLTSIGNDLIIGEWPSSGGNDRLKQLSGLEGLLSINGNLKIVNNRSLQDLTGLNNLASINGNFLIFQNDSLLSLNGINNLKSVNGDLSFGTGISPWMGFTYAGNASLSDLQGIEGLNFIGGDLNILGNVSLISLNGLNYLDTINGNLRIALNDTLKTLAGLENIKYISGGIEIGIDVSLSGQFGNASLINIDALENVNFESNLSIAYNDLLSDCAIKSICEHLEDPSGESFIYDNALGCNSPEEVLDSCEANAVVIAEIDLQEQVLIYPNPTHASITIKLPSQPSKNTSLTLSNTNGQQLITQPITEPQTDIDISHLPVGIYIVKVWNYKDVMVQKVIKQ